MSSKKNASFRFFTKHLQKFLLFLLFSTLTFLGQAQDSDSLQAKQDSSNQSSIFDLSLDELMNSKIVTSTKSEKKISEAPSIISAVTHEEIEKMAVTSLVDVLKFIPSIEVSMGVNGHYRVAIRGIRKDGNILLLVDGHHFNDSYDGRAIYDFPIDFIDRIEVIRGPGSALFGSNAVAGIINIITLKEGKSTSLMFGDHGTYSGSLNYGTKSENSALMVSTGFFQTEGANVDPRSDTINTSHWTYNRSLGTMETNRHKSDFYINTVANYKNLDFSLFGLMRNQGSWVGPLYELAPESEFKNRQFISSLAYTLRTSEKLTIRPKIHTDLVLHDYLIQEHPDGYKAGSEVYTDGAFTKEKYDMVNVGGEVQMEYIQNENISVNSGIEFENMSMLDFILERNHSVKTNTYYGDTPGFKTYLGTQGFWNHDSLPDNLTGKTRQVFAGYLQGEIEQKYFDITAGARIDHYSDFGNSINPRVGLILKLGEVINKSLARGLNMKILYGQAFRAPTFKELHFNSVISSDGIIGNEDLEPEKVATTELSLNYRSKEYNFRIITFFNESNNVIGIYDPEGSGAIGTYENIGSTNSNGLELETSFRINKRFNFRFNYAYFLRTFEWNESLVNPEDLDFIKSDNERKFLVNSPQARINLGLDYTIQQLQVFGGFNYGSETENNKRSAIENINAVNIPPYLQFNYSLKYSVDENLTLQLSGNNIGLKFPAIFGDNFNNTSGKIKYSDPDESTNIEVLGYNGMGQVGNTNRITLRYTF